MSDLSPSSQDSSSIRSWTFRRRPSEHSFNPDMKVLDAEQITSVLGDPGISNPATLPHHISDPASSSKPGTVMITSTTWSNNADDQDKQHKVLSVHFQSQSSDLPAPPESMVPVPPIMEEFYHKLGNYPLSNSFLLGCTMTAIFFYGAGMSYLGIKALRRSFKSSPTSSSSSTNVVNEAARSLHGEQPLVQRATPRIVSGTSVSGSTDSHSVSSSTPILSGTTSPNTTPIHISNEAIIDHLNRIEASLVQAQADRKKENEAVWRELASVFRAKNERVFQNSDFVRNLEESIMSLKALKTQEVEGIAKVRSQIVHRLEEFNLVQVSILEELRETVAQLNVSLAALDKAQQVTSAEPKPPQVSPSQTLVHPDDEGIMSMTDLRSAIESYKNDISLSETTATRENCTPACTPAFNTVENEDGDSGLDATQGDFKPPSSMNRSVEDVKLGGGLEMKPSPRKRGVHPPKNVKGGQTSISSDFESQSDKIPLDADISGFGIGSEINQSSLESSTTRDYISNSPKSPVNLESSRPQAELPPTSFPKTPHLGIDDTGSWRISISTLPPSLPKRSFPKIKIDLIERRTLGFTERARTRGGFLWGPPQQRIYDGVGVTTTIRKVGGVECVLAVGDDGKVDMIHLDGFWWRCSLEGEFYVLRERIDDGAR